MIVPFYKSDDRAFTIVHGDCFDVLPQFDFKFDMIFADPPYFLSNGGISYQAGKVVCVDKHLKVGFEIIRENKEELILRMLKTGISPKIMPLRVFENDFSSFQAVC